MKIKLDENIPISLQPLLEGLGHNVDNVIVENLIGMSDQAVWDAAQQAQRFLITQDLDFSDIRRFLPGTHAGLLVMRLSQGGRKALYQRLQQVFKDEDVETWAGCLVVITDRKIRIRKPVNTH
jgi:predicted nuclease of predicted toxin-antitoxin system